MRVDRVQVLFWFLVAASMSCTAGKTTTKSAERGNNSVLVISENTKSTSSNSETEVIFEGADNEIIFRNLDSFFNDKNSQTVIIVEGNGNTIELVNNKVISNSEGKVDTLKLTGSKGFIKVLNDYLIYNRSQNSSVEINFGEDYQVIEEKNDALLSDTLITSNQVNGEFMTLKEARQYYINESLNGNDLATFYLGQMYETGAGVKRDFRVAQEYYEMAAKNGLSNAQTSLGYFYENRLEGVEPDIEKAMYWYQKSAEQGDEYAKERLLFLKSY